MFPVSLTGQVVFDCTSVVLMLWIPISFSLADVDGEEVGKGEVEPELLGVGEILGVDEAVGDGDPVTLALGLTNSFGILGKGVYGTVGVLEIVGVIEADGVGVMELAIEEELIVGLGLVTATTSEGISGSGGKLGSPGRAEILGTVPFVL